MPDPIQIPLPTPFPVGPVNAYLLTGSEPALIDPGLSWPDAEQALNEGLARHDLRTKDIRYILLTHRHVDHSGLAARICEDSGATLIAHRGNHWFCTEDEEEGPHILDFLRDCGVDEKLLRLVETMFSSSRRLWGDRPLTGDRRAIESGDGLLLGERKLECLGTPGHSPDHICYWEPERRGMFTGDMLLKKITSNPLIHLRADQAWRRSPSLLDYLDSLDRIEAVQPVRAYPGHGPIIEDVGKVIRRNRRHIHKRAERFARLLKAEPVSPDDLARLLFGPRDPINHMLAVSETVAYLDLMEREGWAQVDWQPPIQIQRA